MRVQSRMVAKNRARQGIAPDETINQGGRHEACSDMVGGGRGVARRRLCGGPAAAGARASAPRRDGDRHIRQGGRAVRRRRPVAELPLAQPGGDIWVTQAYPADFNWTEDRAKIKVGLHPPRNGTIFRIVDFVPTTEAMDKMPM